MAAVTAVMTTAVAATAIFNNRTAALNSAAATIAAVAAMAAVTTMVTVMTTAAAAAVNVATAVVSATAVAAEQRGRSLVLTAHQGDADEREKHRGAQNDDTIHSRILQKA
jgi:hypothetical protein